MLNLKKALYSISLIGVLLLVSTISFGQALGNSPYSALGIAQLYSDGFSPINAMGDAGVSNSASGFYTNVMNPALAVRNRFTTLDVGILGQFKRLQDIRQNQQEFSGSLSHLTLAIPAHPKWGFVLGIKPYSSVNYEQNSYSYVGKTIYEAYYQYKGSGGISKVFISNGVKVGKSLSLGIEAGYYFGNINKIATTQVKIGDTRDYTVTREDKLSFSNFSYKLGALWSQKLSDEKYLNFGATYQPNIKYAASSISTLDLSNAGTLITNPDTIKLQSPSLNTPAAFRVGISYEKITNLIVAFDFEKQNWSKYQGINATNDGFRNGQSYHVGLEYLPKVTSTRYRDFIFYRAGFAYRQTPIMIGTKPIDDVSMSFGVGLPVGRNLANLINLTAILGTKGTVSSTTFRERYARFAISFSLKEAWFQKFKVD